MTYIYNRDWAPNLELGYVQDDENLKVSAQTVDRYERLKARQARNGYAIVQQQPAGSTGHTEEIEIEVERTCVQIETATVPQSTTVEQDVQHQSIELCTVLSTSGLEGDSGCFGESMELDGLMIGEDSEAGQGVLGPHIISERANETVQMIDVACQTDVSLESMRQQEERIEILTSELYKAREENNRFQKRLLTPITLQNDNRLLKFYTGFHEWSVFKALFELAEEKLPKSGPKLSSLCIFIMFFLKLRLNLMNEDIGYRFGVSSSTVSRHFHKVLNVLAVYTADLIKWPDRDTLRLTMPTAFRKFFNKCAVIIDCTEVFMERPSNLMARAQVWSNYKHHSTIKFLLGVTPQGTICYISPCAGGRMSDKEIVERSSLINYLIPGDVIIADRGFTCYEYAAMAFAEIKTPPFTKGKQQLEKREIDWSRELSIVRIHVERVIGVMKQKFTILESVIPIALISDSVQHANTTMDKIVKVCAAVVNLCPSVVPQD